MTMVNKILKQMPAVGQPQRTFLVMLCSTILALRGRVNFRHLRRYCDDSERTIARQFRRSVDWPDFHQRVITTALDPQAKVPTVYDLLTEEIPLTALWQRVGGSRLSAVSWRMSAATGS